MSVTVYAGGAAGRSGDGDRDGYGCVELTQLRLVIGVVGFPLILQGIGQGGDLLERLLIGDLPGVPMVFVKVGELIFG